MDRFSGEQRSLACWLALHRTPGVGPITFSRLLEQFGEPEKVFEAPNTAESISARTRSALFKPDWLQIEKDLQWFEPEDRHIVTLYDSHYPELLKQIPDPPSLLFVQGDVSLLSQWQIALVGSRNPSTSGRDTAYEFSAYLAQGGITISSGLAMGIDAAAHQGALSVGGKTVAVVGTGLDRVYPAMNRELAHEIASTGAIVSEFALGTSPRAENFPRRNRIISGLSLGTLVIEAAVKSGSLITARMAMEQGREVFAIPGSIHNPLARGCHQLIRQGAKLVEKAEDILEELGSLAGVKVMGADQEPEAKEVINEDEDYQVLFEFLGYDPIHIDSLIERCGLTADVVSSMLLLLELQGRVESFAGGRYARIGE
ncbi:DNA-processing protein DprA [Pseudomonadota bacterium]|nr:DNA-processing protein DprA [Pseudomonadota bacterium]